MREDQAMRNFFILTSSAVALSITGCGIDGEFSSKIEVSFHHAVSPDLQGLTVTGEHYVFQEITLYGDAVGGELDVELTVYDPSGEKADQATVTFPDEAYRFTPDQVGTWIVVGEASELDGFSIEDKVGEGFLIEVAPPPACDQLRWPTVQDLDLVQPGEEYSPDDLQLVCVNEEGEVIGEVETITVIAEAGAYFDGDTSKFSCELPIDGCTITITQDDQLQLRASGFLPEIDVYTGEPTGEDYPVEQEGSLAQVLGFPPELQCGFHEDAPRVSAQDLEGWARATVADGSDVAYELFVRGIDAQDIGVYEHGSTDQEVLGSGETLSIDLADLPVVVGAGGNIEVTVTAISVWDIERSCEIELEVVPLDPYGHGALAQAWDSSIEPTGRLDFDGPFELRYLLQRYEDYSYAGELFSAAQGYSEFTLSIDGDQITLSVRAETADGDWEDETLEATLDSYDGQHYPQEVRVASSLDSLALIIDGQVRDEVTTAFDFSALSRGQVELAKVPMLTLDSFAFFPGQPAGGPPLESPCTSTLPAQTDGAVCFDFNELGLGSYSAGDSWQGSWGGLLFLGDYEVIGL
jgi:hypothetical protein